MTAATPLSITFQALELPKKLSEASQDASTGYWQFQFVSTRRANNVNSWYLALVQGQVVFSGQKLSWDTFLESLQRYVTRLRTVTAKHALVSLIQESPFEEREFLGKMLGKMGQKGLITYQEAVQALQLKVLSDFDNYFFEYQGYGRFIPDYQLVSQTPIAGFGLDSLIVTATGRREQWKSLRAQIPSRESIPILDPKAVENSSLKEEQKQQLQKLTGRDKTLDDIAYDLAKDPLEVAKMFAKLIHQGFVTIEPPADAVDKAEKNPKIFIVDDSPILLHGFRKLLTQWGYQVSCCTQAEIAVQQMLQSKPVAAFLDLNMPVLSGFALLKDIRRQPPLASLPLVILTAENSVANQWRAKWGSCEFLAKPHTTEELPKFYTELRTLLQKVVNP